MLASPYLEALCLIALVAPAVPIVMILRSARRERRLEARYGDLARTASYAERAKRLLARILLRDHRLWRAWMERHGTPGAAFLARRYTIEAYTPYSKALRRLSRSLARPDPLTLADAREALAALLPNMEQDWEKRREQYRDDVLTDVAASPLHERIDPLRPGSRTGVGIRGVLVDNPIMWLIDRVYLGWVRRRGRVSLREVEELLDLFRDLQTHLGGPSQPGKLPRNVLRFTRALHDGRPRTRKEERDPVAVAV